MSKFTSLQSLLQHFKIALKNTRFIDYNTIAPVALDDWLVNSLLFYMENKGEADKEAYRSDFLVAPLLGEAWKQHPKLQLFSHPNVKIGDFNLYPDYLITGRDKTGVKVVSKPLLLTVETKNETIEQGWFEAAEQAVAAQLFNEDETIPIWLTIATGDLWYFGKLEEKRLYRHPLPLGIAQIEVLFGVLSYVFGECEKYVDED